MENNTLELTVEIKQVYGNKTIYPICEKSQLFANIAGMKTLTEKHILWIKQLGYSFRIKREVL